MATVFIPYQWRDLTDGVASVTLPGATVRDIATSLEQRFPGIGKRMCVGEEISPALAVSIDGAIASRGMRSPLKPDSEVHFLPAIGGG